MMPKPSLILLKIHRWENFFLELADHYSRVRSADFKFLVDETRGEIDTRGFDKISFSIDEFNKIGLVTDDQWVDGQLFNNPVWYNSDYPTYSAYLQFPEYEYYWIMDYDILINFANYNDFFADFDNNKTDLLGTVIHKPWHGWLWRRDAARVFREVWAIFWPIMRLSNRATAYALTKRLVASHRYRTAATEDDRVWPFCEAWLASELCDSGKFSVADLNAGGFYYDHPNGGYALRPNRRYELLRKGADKLVYHPVLNDHDFLYKSFYWHILRVTERDPALIRSFAEILQRCAELDENKAVCRALAAAVTGVAGEFAAGSPGRERLAGQRWWFGRSDGSTIAENLYLRPDGTVAGAQDGPAGWAVRDGSLVLLDAAGAPLTTLGQACMSAAGALTLRDRPPAAGEIAHVLAENSPGGSLS